MKSSFDFERAEIKYIRRTKLTCFDKELRSKLIRRIKSDVNRNEVPQWVEDFVRFNRRADL